jgi:predicted nicotinamide N-methyase
VAVVGAAGLHIRALRDRRQYFDPRGDAEGLGISSATWPLFGLLWPSAHPLAAHMALRAVTAGERILEIGCGLGLASLVGHRRGADVTASDCHPLAARFLRANVRLNGLLALPYRHGHWQAVDGMAAPAGETSVSGRFDLLIGSDLLYERDDGAGLARFITLHAAPGAQVWLVDPNRGNRPAFHRQMAERGFSRSEERIDLAATGDRAAYHGRWLGYSL